MPMSSCGSGVATATIHPRRRRHRRPGGAPHPCGLGRHPLLAITTSRQWAADQCAPVVAGLQAKGWLTHDEEPTITDEGRRRRDVIEDATDEADAFAYEDLSDIELARLVDLAAVVGAEVSAKVVQPGVRPTGHDKSFTSR